MTAAPIGEGTERGLGNGDRNFKGLIMVKELSRTRLREKSIKLRDELGGASRKKPEAVKVST